LIGVLFKGFGIKGLVELFWLTFDRGVVGVRWSNGAYYSRLF